MNPDNQGLLPSSLLSKFNFNNFTVDLAFNQSINLYKASILGVLILPFRRTAIF